MLINLSISIVIIAITIVIHSLGMAMVLHSLKKYDQKTDHQKQRWQTHIFWVSQSIILMFIVSIIEVLVWALTFLALNAIENIEHAFYFSMVTYTTLGYGDVLLDERWRILGSFEAAIGIIMFGWTTAIVITVIQRLYKVSHDVS
jgi:magnesium-transporting ATPase (P-type)